MGEKVHDKVFASVESAREQMTKDHPGVYTSPWWGDKESANMKNRGYVIGLKDDTKKSRWRLDFDPDKGLHINWVQDVVGDEQLKECYKISALNPQQVMFDYYVGMTKTRHSEIPADIKGRLGADKKWWGAYWA